MSERAYEKLIRYSAFERASDENSETCPSTKNQFSFAEVLRDELIDIGASDVYLDENGYVYAVIKATDENYEGKTVAFIAHMDVSPDAPSTGIKPCIKKYDGTDIVLDNGMTLSEKEFPELSEYRGKTLLVTTGDTLLGADDKAGIAEIMCAAEILINNKDIKHGDVKICFTPDEEIGRGADRLNLERLNADCGFTMDGDMFGGVEYETFNAAAVHVEFKGFNVHPGSAKGKLKNATLMATEFVASFPDDERPETTDGYEGYYFINRIKGDSENACIDMLIRDHDREKFEKRKDFVSETVNKIKSMYGKECCEAQIKDSYYNMKEKILPDNQFLIDAAYEAVKKAGGVPFSKPVRGGTDGAMLSFKGLPCPNLGTGCGNYHSRMEYACIEDMDKCIDVIINIIKELA